MKIKIFALLLAMLVAMLAFASCEGEGAGEGDGGGDVKPDPNTQTHTHTFSESWKSNDKKHWHQATCEHGEYKDSEGDHADTDEDGFCDVCAYEVGHKHKYDVTKWVYDESNHWYAATCSHKDEKKAIALHTDVNEDGKCDYCSGHVHKKGSSGYCVIEGCNTLLEEIENSNLTGIINAVVNQGSLVNGVQIQSYVSSKSAYGDYYDSVNQVWNSYNRTTEENVSILFGKNGYVNTFIDATTTTGSKASSTTVTQYTYESWFEADGKSTFGVVSENGANPYRVTVESEQLLGYSFNLSTLVGAYGTENFLYNIYEVSQGEGVTDFVIEIGENNQVSFSFSLLSVERIEGVEITDNNGEITTGDKIVSYNAEYYEVSVSFTYNDHYVITSLDTTLNIYKSNMGKIGDEPNLKDVNIKYYPETGKFDFVKYDESYTSEDGDNYKVVDKSTLTPIVYSYSVTQTVGDRTAENEYPKTSYIPTGFDLFTDTEHTAQVTEDINTTTKSFVYLYIGNCKPEGSSIDYVFEMIDYDVLDSNGKKIEGTDLVSGDSTAIKAGFTFSPEEGRFFMIYVMKAGTYSIVVKLDGEVVHTVKIVVK